MNEKKGLGLLLLAIGIWLMLQNPVNDATTSSGAILAGLGLILFATK